MGCVFLWTLIAAVHFDVEKEGHGILFVIPVSKAYGIK